MPPVTLTAEFRIVTPMFIGGADQSPSDGIRPPSVKGALRFWWRALNWARYCQDGTDHAEALRKLHKEESRLFGNAAKEENGKQLYGQGQFLLSVQSDKLKCTDKNQVHQQFASHSAARYLGYGLMEAFGANAGKLERGCINDGQQFTVKLRFRDEVDSSITNALIALGLLGGLGSRSRHGMGSLRLNSLYQENEIIWNAPVSKDKYIEAIQPLLAGTSVAIGQPPYTAFSDQSRVDVLLTDNTPYKILDGFGHGEMMYRSWGRDGTVLNQPSEKNFAYDHHWSKGAQYPGFPTNPNFHPQRVVFGLPHNYQNKQVKPENHERRSSPLLFHVHGLTENSYVGISVLLPATFLPLDEKITAGRNDVTANIEWNFFDKFLDGRSKANNQPRFPNKTSVVGTTK